ncbi:MAG: hypothetical protein V4808_01170 [Pseudomonadota bacterium]
MLRLLAAFLALLPLPAWADVTATYSAGKMTLLVESDDNGNSRIGIEGKFGIIRRDGFDYAVMALPNGETKVTELSELLSFISAAVAGESKKDAASVLDKPFVLTMKGDVMVGDRKGTLWNFGPEKEKDGRAGQMKEFVMSADPALAPVGAIFARTVEALMPLMAAIIPESTGFSAKARNLFSSGAPLRIDTLVALQSVTVTEIDPKRFELPAPVIPAMEFMMAMNPASGTGAFSPLP